MGGGERRWGGRRRNREGTRILGKEKEIGVGVAQDEGRGKGILRTKEKKMVGSVYMYDRI